MSQFAWPLSGDVRQAFGWWQTARQVGLINIEQPASSDPELEHRIIRDVASYGKQLGRMMDALSVVIDRAQAQAPFTGDGAKAIADFEEVAAAIEKEKREHATRVEDLLDRVIDEAHEKKDTYLGRLLIDRMRQAVASLEHDAARNNGREVAS